MNPHGTPIPYLRSWLGAAALAAGLSANGFAQAPVDPIERAKATQNLAEQKAENEIVEAIASADKLKTVSTPKAIQRLKDAQTGLAVSVSLGQAKRTELDARLEAKIGILEGKLPAARPDTDPNANAVKLREKLDQLKAAVELREVADGLKKAADAADANRHNDARRHVLSLAEKYPNNPQIIALSGQTNTSDQIRANQKLSRDYADAWLVNQRQVVASSIPTTDDIQFPDAKKWQALTKLRKNQDRIQLSPKEESILKSLDTAFLANFADRPFEEALQELSNAIDQPIFIDKKSLEDAGLDLSRKVTFKGNVTARTALRALLQANQLTFIVKEEMIQVVTMERAEKELTTRSYYLGDLVQGVGPFGNAVVWGPNLSYQQTVTNSETIVKSITDSIDPRSWKQAGGPCTITFHMPTMSVVVRASTEVHASMGYSVGKK